jgi:hypothetical protein
LKDLERGKDEDGEADGGLLFLLLPFAGVSFLLYHAHLLP